MRYLQHCCSVAKLCLILQPNWLQHARLPCPSPSPRVCSNSCPSSWWCHPTISSSVVSSSCLQSFPASGSFPMSQFFTSGGQSIRASASASVLPVNIQHWFPLRLTGLLSLYQSIIDVDWWGRGAIFMMMSHHFIELAFLWASVGYFLFPHLRPQWTWDGDFLCPIWEAKVARVGCFLSSRSVKW